MNFLGNLISPGGQFGPSHSDLVSTAMSGLAGIPPGRAPAGPRGMFGRRPGYSTPGIGDDINGAPDMGMAPLVKPQTFMEMGGGVLPPSVSQQIDTARSPAFFDKNGAWRSVVGNIGDALQQMTGGRPTYGPMMQERQRITAQQQQQAAEWARRDQDRTYDRDEWTRRETFKREHPDDQFTQYLIGAGIDPGSPQGRAMYRQRAETMATPPTVAVDGFDAQGNPTKTFMPRAGIGIGGQPQGAGPAVGTIRNGYRFNGGNPNDRSSWVPVGGASSNGGATFR